MTDILDAILLTAGGFAAGATITLYIMYHWMIRKSEKHLKDLKEMLDIIQNLKTSLEDIQNTEPGETENGDNTKKCKN